MMKNAPSPSTEPDISGDRRITLEQLRVFVAVSRTKSFQAAGLRLGRTQSAITQSMKNLEDYLGCRLLERRQGSVVGLTGEGGKLLPKVAGLLEEMDALVRSVQHPEAKEHIRFGIPLNVGAADLQNALAGCMAENKNIRVRLISDTSMHLAAMLESGALDAAIVNEGATSATGATPAVTHTLLEESLVWVARPNAPADWTDEVPLIAFSEGSPWTQAAVEALRRAGVAHYYAYVSTSYESVCGAIDEGMGITAMPLSRVPKKYVPLADDGRLPPLPKVRTVIRARTKSRAVLEFCELVGGLPVFARAGAE